MADAAPASLGVSPAHAGGGELGDGIVEEEGRAGSQDRDGGVEERTRAGFDAAGTAGDEVTTTRVLVQEGRGSVSAVTREEDEEGEEEVLGRETDASEGTGSGRVADGGSSSVRLKETVLETSPGMEDQVEVGTLVCGKGGDAVDVECGMVQESLDDGVLCTGAASLVDGGRSLGDAVDVVVGEGEAGASEGLRGAVKGEGEVGADVVDEVRRGIVGGSRTGGGGGFGVDGKDGGEGKVCDRQGLEDVCLDEQEQGEGRSAEFEEGAGRSTGECVATLISTTRTGEQSVVHGGGGFGVEGKDVGEGKVCDRQGLDDVCVDEQEQAEGRSAECEEGGGRTTGGRVAIMISTTRTGEQSVGHGESEGDCCGVCGYGVVAGCAEFEGTGSCKVEMSACTASLSNGVERDVVQPEGMSPAGTSPPVVHLKQVEDVVMFGGSVLGFPSVEGMEVNDTTTESEIAKFSSREEDGVACAADVRHEPYVISDVCVSRLEKIDSENMEVEPSNPLEREHVISFCKPEDVSMVDVDKGSVAEPQRAASALAVSSAGEITEPREGEVGAPARQEAGVAYIDASAEEEVAPTTSRSVVGIDEPRTTSASGEASCGKATWTGLGEEVSSSLLSGATVQESVRKDSGHVRGEEMKSEAEAETSAKVATGDADKLVGSITTKRLPSSVKVESLEDVQKDNRLEPEFLVQASKPQGPEVVTDVVGEVLEDSAVEAVVPDSERPGHLNAAAAAGGKAYHLLDLGTLEEAISSPEVGGRPASMCLLPIALCGCGTPAVEKIMGTKSVNRGLRYLSCSAFAHKQPNGKKRRQLEANGCKFFQVTEEEKPRKQKRRRLEDPGPVSSGNVSTRSASKHAYKGKPSPEHINLQPSLDSSSMLESTPPASEMSGSSSKQQTTSSSFEDRAKPPGGTGVSKVSTLKEDSEGESASGSEIAGKSASDSRSAASRSKSGKVKAVKSFEKTEYPEDRRNPTVDWLVSKRPSFKSLSDLGDEPLPSSNNKNIASKRRNLSSNSKLKFGTIGSATPGRRRRTETPQQTRGARTADKAGSSSVTPSLASAKKGKKVASNTVAQSGSHGGSSQRKRASVDKQKGMKPGNLLTADRHRQTARDTNTKSKTGRKTPHSTKARQGASVPDVAGQNVVDDETEDVAQPAKRMKAGDRIQVGKGGNKASKPEEIWVTVPLESPVGRSKEAKQKGSKLSGENARAHLRTKVVANLDRAEEKRSLQAVKGACGNLAATPANILSDTGCTNDSVGRSTASKDRVSSTCSGHSTKFKPRELGS